MTSSHASPQLRLLSRREACRCGAGLLGLVATAAMASPVAWASESGGGDQVAPTDQAAAGQKAPATSDGPNDPLASLFRAPELPDAHVAVEFPATIVDDLGRTVEIASLDAVAACMGSFARLWELAGGSLVGVTDDALCDYVLTNADALTTVGQFTAPNLEQILALEPSLVICSAATSGRGGQASQLDLQQPLEAAGVPVAFFEVTVFEDYLRVLATCCGLTGRGDLYHANGVEVASRVRAVIEASREAAADQGAAGDAAPTCLLMTTYSGGVRVSTSATQAGAMLAALGAANLADQNPSLLKDFSLEAAIGLDPRFVFVIPMGDDEQAAQKAFDELTANDPAWGALSAVAEGRCFVLDPALSLYKPLDRWDEAYAELAADLWGIDPAVALGRPAGTRPAPAGSDTDRAGVA